MAGYIMTLDSEDSLRECIENGIYSTRFPDPKNEKWIAAAEGTFADYYSMKAEDSIFFFIKRKIFGIGKLINIKGDCKYLNYYGSDEPKVTSQKEYYEAAPLMKNGNINNRCLCVFIPAPYFFMRSVDMDEALGSNPQKFRMLRAMWKTSFMKLDDEETKALIDIILKRNENSLLNGEGVYPFHDSIHQKIQQSLDEKHIMHPYSLLAKSAEGLSVKHEMAIEAYLCSILGKDNESPFGQWDYVSHQVVASPFKPIDYMDKMDIFGYRYIKGFNTISKYLAIEIKKDKADPDVIDQIMKYVDWINQEYSHGDYSMIEAYVVAFDFPQEVIDKRNRECVRNYIKGYRPSEASTWSAVKLIRYEYYDDGMDFIEV